MDIDTTVKGQDFTLENAQRIVSEVAAVQLDDGVSFVIKDVETIMDEMEYPGIRFHLDAVFEKMITPIKIDVSTGDVITPRAIEYNYKLMLEEREIELWSYNLETVVLLSKGVVDKDNFRKVKVDFSLEEMDLTELRGKATYAQVKEYILNEFGLKVSSLYIAQVKRKCGIETGENHNLPKSEDARQPQVTPEKEEAIMKAFKHFGVI